MLNFKSVIALFALVFGFYAQAQNMGAFLDRRGHFFIYDNGVVSKHEFLPIKFFKVGGDCVVYENIKGEYIVYGNGNSQRFTAFTNPDQLQFSENFMLTRMAGLLTVITNSQAKTISLRNRVEVAGGNESIDVYDRNRNKFLTQSLDDGSFAFGDRTIAFVDYDDRFKIFEGKENKEIEFDPPLSYAVSDDMVAYIDETNQLKLYSEGQTEIIFNDFVNYRVGNSYLFYVDDSYQLVYVDAKTLEKKNLAEDVLDYIVGDNVFAFLDYYDAFFVVENGEAIELFDYPPDNYAYYGDMLYYEDAQGISHVRYKGEDFPLEVYPLNRVQFYDDIVVYIDREGYLKGVYEGVPFHLTNEQVTQFDLQFRVIVYQTGNQDFHIFHDGKVVY